MAMSEKKKRQPKKDPVDAKTKGRPPLFNSVGALELKADEYFEYIKGELKKDMDSINDILDPWVRPPEPATITGLTLFLGFSDRASFYDYCENGHFAHALKRYRTRIENEYEKKLAAPMCTGSIFALKNMGWADNQKTELTGAGGKDLGIPVINLNVVQPKTDEDE